jgi:hypothetical protein
MGPTSREVLPQNEQVVTLRPRNQSRMLVTSAAAMMNK